MKLAYAILAIAAIATGAYLFTTQQSSLMEDPIVKEFENFILYNRRSYASIDEFNYRLDVFKANLKIAAKLQETNDEAVFGVTIFMD